MVSCCQKDGFTVVMDAQCYEPHELSVKVVNNFIVVEGQTDEREVEGGFVSTKIVRKFPIPENCDREKIVCSMSEDGKLNVKVPLKEQKPPGERIVEVKQIGETKPSSKEHLIKINLTGFAEPPSKPVRHAETSTSTSNEPDTQKSETSEKVEKHEEKRTGNVAERRTFKSCNERIVEVKQTGVFQRNR